VGSTAITYDLSGNTLNDGTNTYVWDARNRLVSANWNAAILSYDGSERRESKSIMPTNAIRPMLVLILLLLSGTAPCAAQAGRPQDRPDPEAAARLAYAVKINKTYIYPFAKGNIALPVSAAV
jgi:YD repeat-containing protein